MPREDIYVLIFLLFLKFKHYLYRHYRWLGLRIICTALSSPKSSENLWEMGVHSEVELQGLRRALWKLLFIVSLFRGVLLECVNSMSVQQCSLFWKNVAFWFLVPSFHPHYVEKLTNRKETIESSRVTYGVLFWTNPSPKTNKSSHSANFVSSLFIVGSYFIAQLWHTNSEWKN